MFPCPLRAYNVLKGDNVRKVQEREKVGEEKGGGGEFHAACFITFFLHTMSNFLNCPFLILRCAPQDRSILSPNSLFHFFSSFKRKW